MSRRTMKLKPSNNSTPGYNYANGGNHSVDVKHFSHKASISPNERKHTNSSYERHFLRVKTQVSPIPQFNPSHKHSAILKNNRRASFTNGIHTPSGNIKANHSLSMDRHFLMQKYEQAKEYLRTGKYKAAIPYFKQLVQIIDNNKLQRQIYFCLVISLDKTGMLEQAQQVIASCLDAFPDFMDMRVLDARIKVKLGNLNEAIAILEKIVIVENKDPEPWIDLGQCYIMADHRSKANSLWQKAVSKFKDCTLLHSKLAQNLLKMSNLKQAQHHLLQLQSIGGKLTSEFCYLKGLLEKSYGRQQHACIFFEECLKFNTSKYAVGQSIEELLELYISKRDYYAAYHVSNRCRYLNVHKDAIDAFALFLEGVILVMKKKFEEGIKVLLQASKSQSWRPEHKENISSLIHKFIAYAHFKLGQHKESIQFYNMIDKQHMDLASNYNLLLAQGIIEADSNQHYEDARNYFQTAKSFYPNKVQPYIYISMLVINDVKPGKAMQSAVLEAIQILNNAQEINPNSSNLLYHRAILYLYLQDWQEVHKDINRCIEKAEENLPKYFYLRGLNYSCVKEFKRAANEYSICISLSKDQRTAYLERAKCNFLIGNTENGFGDLQIYMSYCPQDYSVHKWIGDLLYEGGSYSDSLKAYSEMRDNISLQALVMTAKCQLRLGNIKKITNLIKTIENTAQSDQQKCKVDLMALNLLNSFKVADRKELALCIEKLNCLIEEDFVGYIFQLIDCMNLLGSASFYQANYAEAYESFLLVQQLFRSMSSEGEAKPAQEDNRNLKLEDIYSNMFICQLAEGETTQAVRLLREELSECASKIQMKTISRILKELKGSSKFNEVFESCSEIGFNHKMKQIDIQLHHITLKCRAIFHPFHQTVSQIYSNSIARGIITQLHAAYIDNMPQGPWIKRNQFGVVFTDEQLQNQNEFTLDTSERHSHSREQQKQEGNAKEKLLENLRFDQNMETRIERLIKKR